MIDTQRFFTILIEGISFVAAFAAVAAAFIMYEVTKKFGSGILASGFKSISAGVLFLALGIIIVNCHITSSVFTGDIFFLTVD